MTRAVLRFAVAPLFVFATSYLAVASALAQSNVGPHAAAAALAPKGRMAHGSHLVFKPVATKSDAPAPEGQEQLKNLTTQQWLTRIQQAANAPTYTGTYVVWTAPGTLASSKIWRASKGYLHVERVDALSGQPRTTFRVIDKTGSDIETFLPAQHLVRIEHHDLLGEGSFPNLTRTGAGFFPANFYHVHYEGQERVSGFVADVIKFLPRDTLRYNYRVWCEQRTGIVLKVQTLDDTGHVLEQAAFSGLAFDTPITVSELLHQRQQTQGWRIDQIQRAPTTAVAEGWQIGKPVGQPVPGFTLQRCYRQPTVILVQQNTMGEAVGFGGSPRQGGLLEGGLLQCVYSDGLSSVSVFIEPQGAQRHVSTKEGEVDASLGGATHLLERRVSKTGWLTVVGEVPQQTLARFAQGVSVLP